MGRATHMHRGQGDEEHNVTTQYQQGTGPPIEAGRWGERVCGWWRQA